MITIKKVKTESRPRDKKRKRLLLTIGDRSIHITREEAIRMKNDIMKAIKG